MTLLPAIAGGIEAGTITSTFTRHDATDICGTFDGGINRDAWIGGELGMPGLLPGRFDLRGSLGVVLRGGSFTGEMAPLLIQGDDVRRQVVEVAHEEHYRFTEYRLRCEVTAGTALFGAAWVGIGPWVEYRIGTRSEQVDSITDPLYRFPGGLRVVPVPDGARPALARLGGGLVASVELAGTRGAWSVTPRLQLRASLLPGGADQLRRGFDVGVGIRVAVPAGPGESPSAPLPPQHDAPDSSAAPPASPRPLAAAIALRVAEAKGGASPAASVEIRATRRIDLVHLDPTIRLDAAGEIASADLLPLDRTRAGRFMPDSLEGSAPELYRRHLLNVIGRRLAAGAGARLSLRIMPGDPAADRGAAMIRSYIHDVWGIEESRLGVERVPGMPRRVVTLAADSAAILAPLRAERVAAAVDPPPVEIDPTMSGDRIAGWEIFIRHGARLLARLTSDGGGGRRLRWAIAADDTLPLPLVATLVVRDSAGHQAAASDSIPLVIRRREWSRVRRIGAGVEAVTLTLAAGDDRDAETLAREGEELRALADQAVPGARPSVVIPAGPAATARATRVRAALEELFGQRGMPVPEVTIEAPR